MLLSSLVSAAWPARRLRSAWHPAKQSPAQGHVAHATKCCEKLKIVHVHTAGCTSTSIHLLQYNIEQHLLCRFSFSPLREIAPAKVHAVPSHPFRLCPEVHCHWVHFLQPPSLVVADFTTSACECVTVVSITRILDLLVLGLDSPALAHNHHGLKQARPLLHSTTTSDSIRIAPCLRQGHLLASHILESGCQACTVWPAMWTKLLQVLCHLVKSVPAEERRGARGMIMCNMM